LITPGLVVAVFLITALLFILLALSQLRRRRLFAATRAAAGGGLCLALAALAFSLALNLYTYNRLTREQPVAQLRFEQIGASRYRVYLRSPHAAERHYVLAGDGWQLGARVIKWQPWAALIGFNAVYQLDRISGRYSRIDAARNLPDSVYDLSSTRGLDVLHAARYLPSWLNPIDARFGNAAYLPMADGARFSVALSQTAGLIARPENAAAQTAIAQW